MTRFFDGNRLVGITLQTWTGNGYTPDWSADAFDVGLLPYDEAREAHIVPNVAYCIEWAEAWEAEAPDNMCTVDEYSPETGALLPELEAIEALPLAESH